MSHKETQQNTQQYSRKWQLPPLEEQWPSEEVFHRGEGFRGRSFFLYSINEEEPIYGLPGLPHILPIASSGLYRSPLLVPSKKELMQFGLLGVSTKTNLQQEDPSMSLETLLELSHLVRLTIPHLSQPQPGWRQFGFMVFREEGITVPGLGMLVSVRWQFALEWSQPRSTWDVLLFSLDHLHLKMFTLPLASLLPTLFVVCMADRPDDSRLNTIIAAWGSMLHELCQALDPLLRALSTCWINGPSRSAFRYRQCIEYRPTNCPLVTFLPSETGGRYSAAPFAKRCAPSLEAAYGHR